LGHSWGWYARGASHGQFPRPRVHGYLHSGIQSRGREAASGTRGQVRSETV